MSSSFAVAAPSTLPTLLPQTARPSISASLNSVELPNSAAGSPSVSSSSELPTPSFATLVDELIQEVAHQSGAVSTPNAPSTAEAGPARTTIQVRTAAPSAGSKPGNSISSTPEKPRKLPAEDSTVAVVAAIIQSPQILLPRLVIPANNVSPVSASDSADTSVEVSHEIRSAAGPHETLRLIPNDTVLQIRLRNGETDTVPNDVASAGVPAVPTQHDKAPTASVPAPAPSSQVKLPANAPVAATAKQENSAPAAKPSRHTDAPAAKDSEPVKESADESKDGGTQPDARQNEPKQSDSKRLAQHVNAAEHGEAARVTPETFAAAQPTEQKVVAPTTNVVEKQLPQRVPESTTPVAHVGHEPAAPPAPPQQVRSVALEFTPDGGRDVRLRVVERGGEVHVSLHSNDADLTGRLRDGVQDLAGSLTHAGYDGEAWTPRDNGRQQQQQPEPQEQEHRGRTRSGGSDEEFAGLFNGSVQEAK